MEVIKRALLLVHSSNDHNRDAEAMNFHCVSPMGGRGAQSRGPSSAAFPEGSQMVRPDMNLCSSGMLVSQATASPAVPQCQPLQLF